MTDFPDTLTYIGKGFDQMHEHDARPAGQKLPRPEATNIADLLCRYSVPVFANSVPDGRSDPAALVMRAVCLALMEEYRVISSDLPGIVAPDKPLIVSRYFGFNRADNRQHRLFICYRRRDSSGLVGRMANKLQRTFGSGTIFRDIDNLSFGSPFPDELRKHVLSCRAVLVAIGPEWNALASEGVGRLSRPDDVVRLEIEIALDAGIPVIPVLLDNFALPPTTELPQSLHHLVHLRPVRLRGGKWFRADIQRVEERCTGYLRQHGEAPGLFMPGLDQDAYGCIRVMAGLAVYFRRLMFSQGTGHDDLRQLLTRPDERHLLEVADAALDIWCVHTGLVRASKRVWSSRALSHIEAMPLAILRRLSSLKPDEIAAMLKRLAKDEGADTTIEQVFAMAATQTLGDHFVFVRRQKRAPQLGRPLYDEAEHSFQAESRGHRTFVAIAGSPGSDWFLRVREDLQLHLGLQIHFGSGRFSGNRGMAGCRHFVLFIGADFQAWLRNDKSVQLLQAQLALAQTRDMRVIPVLLPEATLPAGRETPSALNAFLQYNVLSLRSDPDYETDLAVLVQLLSAETRRRAFLRGMPLPDVLPLPAVLPVRVLLKAGVYFRSCLLRLARGEITWQRLQTQEVSVLEMTNAAVDAWSVFFGLRDEEAISSTGEGS